MRIFMLATVARSHQAFSLPVAKHLRAQGHEVVLGCSPDDDELGKAPLDELRQEGFEVVTFPMKRTLSPWSNLKATVQLWWYLSCFRDALIAYRYWRTL